MRRDNVKRRLFQAECLKFLYWGHFLLSVTRNHLSIVTEYQHFSEPAIAVFHFNAAPFSSQ